MQYPDLLVQSHDEAPVLSLLKGEEVVDEFFVGHYDREGMHNLMSKLGVKRDETRTIEKLQKEMELEKAFATKGEL